MHQNSVSRAVVLAVRHVVGEDEFCVSVHTSITHCVPVYRLRSLAVSGFRALQICKLRCAHRSDVYDSWQMVGADVVRHACVHGASGDQSTHERTLHGIILSAATQLMRLDCCDCC